VGDFVAFITYLSMLTWPLMALGMIIGFIQQGLASLSRLGRVFSAGEGGGGRARPLASPPPDTPLDMEFTGLSFKYPTREKPALKNISLRLPHNGITALIGPMGGGKSTLAALLPALYEAEPGTLRVGGRLIEEWPAAELRARLGFVPQDGFMFSGPLFDNLVFGKPDASREEALAAAAAAGLADEIAAFPGGLDTIVGERGVTLSGGQRQRLALARALLIDPDYLIMDDTLSAVDAAVEAEIMSRLLPLRKGRGTLIISHRLISLMGVDRIVVLEEGRVTDQGTPAELMARESYFKRVLELNRFDEGAADAG
jgi:ATP-binding cassette subfamily B protein